LKEDYNLFKFSEWFLRRFAGNILFAIPFTSFYEVKFIDGKIIRSSSINHGLSEEEEHHLRNTLMIKKTSDKLYINILWTCSSDNSYTIGLSTNYNNTVNYYEYAIINNLKYYAGINIKEASIMQFTKYFIEHLNDIIKTNLNYA
jgi:hypothetical protein